MQDYVVAKYKDTPLWMKTPNGQPTKLTERQWVMVRTPNFKNWFGDWENDPQNASKVVDENGEPLVVYHGTNEYEVKKTWNDKTRTYDNEYKKFTIFKSKLGNFFNSSIDNAGGYGLEVYKTFLNIKNPLVIDAKNAHFSEVEFEGETKGTYDWVKEAKSKGFDGVIFNNIRDGIDYGAISVSTNDYVAFNSNQIKSATDNIGTYDPSNPDIQFSFIETRSQAELDELNKKHRDLYERYKNGDKEAYKQAVELTKAEAERKGVPVKVYHGTGADGFNVADATSKHEENGEGAQAHGAGLYMAVSRETAENYQMKTSRNKGKKKIDVAQIYSDENKLKDIKDKVGYKSVEDLKEDLSILVDIPYFNQTISYFKHLLNIQTKSKLGIIKIHRNYVALLEKQMQSIREDKDVYTEEEIEEKQREYDEKINTKKSQIKTLEDDIEKYRKALKREQKVKKLINLVNGNSGGHIFDWFTNLNEDNTLDVDKPLTEQGESVRKAIFEFYKSRPDDFITPKNIDDLNKHQDGERFYKEVVFQMRREGASNPQLEASKLLAKLGIKGLTYVGRQDGRCYVSFEGGATVKLQDPFTFDDNGELIPLSERFDEGNADMRFSLVDTPQEFKETINSIVSEIRYIKENNIPTDSELLKQRYAKYDDKGEKILDLKVAKLNEKQAKYFGLEDVYVYTSLFDILDHHFNHHPELNETAYYNLPKTINSASVVASGNIDNSYLFGIKLNKWFVSTSFIIKNSNRAILYKNFYITSKPKKVFKDSKIIKELTSWEDWQPSIQPTPNGSKGSASGISALQDVNKLTQSKNNSGSQGNFSLIGENDIHRYPPLCGCLAFLIPSKARRRSRLV